MMDGSRGFPSSFMPKLSPDELSKELKKLQTEVSPSFWRNPTAEDVQGFYSVAIEYILGKRLEDIRLEEMCEEGSEVLVNASSLLPQEGTLHFRAIGNLRFLRYCQHMAKSVIGFSDFTRQDLMNPTSERIIKFANCFVHFCRFRDSIVQRYEARMDEVIAVGREERNLDMELKNLSSELTNLQNAKEKQMALTMERKTLHQTVIEQVSSLSQKYKSGLSEISAVQKEVDVIENKLKSVEFQLATTKQKNQELKVRAVHDPQKLKAELVRLEQCINELNAELTKNETQMLLTKKLAQLVEQANKKIKSMNGILEAHQKDTLKRFVDSKSESKEIERKIKIKQNELIPLEKELASINRKISELEVKVKTAQATKIQTEEENRKSHKDAENLNETHQHTLEAIQHKFKEISDKERQIQLQKSNETQDFNMVVAHLLSRETYVTNFITTELKKMRSLAN